MSKELLAPVWTHLTEMQPARAEGIYFYDEDGTRYTDFTSGIGVTNTGHCHPRVVKAIQEQAGKLIFGQINIVVSKPVLELAKKLNEITPDVIDRFFFSNSGAEAVEAIGQIGKASDRQAKHHRNAGQLPRPYSPNDGHDHLKIYLPSELSAASGSRFCNAVPLCVLLWMG